MSPGGGTPWEDRGSLGLVKAFFVTCVDSLRNPRRLFNSIRRPETTGDAMGFAIGCGMMWLVSVLVHGGIAYVRVLMSGKQEVDSMQFWLQWGMLAVAAPAGLLLLMRLGVKLYHKLVAAEMPGRLSAPLVVNVFAYALGPSLLAVIPYVGPLLAAGGILWLLIVGSIVRLNIARGGAISCSAITFGAMAILALVAGFGGSQLFRWKSDHPTVWDKPVQTAPQVRSR
jgi:hypothetical protein